MSTTEQPVRYTNERGTPLHHEPPRDTSMGELWDLRERYGMVVVEAQEEL